MNKRHRKLVRQFCEWNNQVHVSSDELERWRVTRHRLIQFERHIPAQYRQLNKISVFAF